MDISYALIVAYFTAITTGLGKKSKKMVIMMYREIKRVARSKNMTIKYVEHESGLGSGTIRRWDHHSPMVRNLQAVAHVLGVDASTLIDRKKLVRHE